MATSENWVELIGKRNHKLYLSITVIKADVKGHKYFLT